MGYLRYEREFDSELLKRPDFDISSIEDKVDQILSYVRKDGDKALIELAAKFDESDVSESLYASESDFDEAENLVPQDLKDAILRAHKNISAFHIAQMPKGECVETEAGVLCSRRIVAIDKVGLYVPGGTAPLFSTVLMLAIPAKVAGCKEIILATPAKFGKISPAVLYAARVCGVDKVLKVGGAQAIAALAYGTESVPKVDKIFGPGNRFVSTAKMKVQSFCAIDMLAGPSEVMVVVDKSANPLYAAADLLSQAEHGKDSQVVLAVLASSIEEADSIYNGVEEALSSELEKLGRKEFMLPSLSHSVAFAFTDKDALLDAINLYGPEHLIINTLNDEEILDGVRNAGSVFMGPYSPESAGDYASGTNHTLPTSGWASSSSGVSLDSFIKKITVQRLTKKGIENLAPTVIKMAEAEGLTAHAEAARVRVL